MKKPKVLAAFLLLSLTFFLAACGASGTVEPDMGETLDFEILTQDINFDEPVIIEAIAMIDGVEESAGKTAPMELRPGENYRFELARDPEMQFREVQEN
jgi:predicted anti-sigma-YlaC factor YlaD